MEYNSNYDNYDNYDNNELPTKEFNDQFNQSGGNIWEAGETGEGDWPNSGEGYVMHDHHKSKLDKLDNKVTEIYQALGLDEGTSASTHTESEPQGKVAEYLKLIEDDNPIVIEKDDSENLAKNASAAFACILSQFLMNKNIPNIKFQ
tara:strand:- start:1621 stop:2061 length:441 start_codon:yes stop_codon:yes gene_type:complete